MLRSAAQLPDGGFEDLLSLEGVDELVSRRGLRTPFVRMSRDGDVLPSSRFTRGGGVGAEIADQVADDKVLAQFTSGATLVLQGLHRTWPPIERFARELAAQLGHPVQVNAYVTPPENTGFAPHYDVHDVFVVQFAGRKRWRIYEPVLESPLREQPWQEHKSAVAARASKSPLIESVLECGDALYLPRGYIHAATSLNEISGHLTIGVHPLTRRTLADQILAMIVRDVELRRSLPLGIDLRDEGAIDEDLKATVKALHALVDTVDRAEIARALARHVGAATRPAPLAPVEQFSAAAELAPGTRVCLRPGLHPMFRTEDDVLMIEVLDREVEVKMAHGQAARLAVSGAVVSADVLPGVDAREGVALLSQLLREGVVVPV